MDYRIPTREEVKQHLEKQKELGHPLPQAMQEYLENNHEAFFEKAKRNFNRPRWKKLLHLRLTTRAK